jgi:putative peptidoglycan lipid II flippase
LKYGGFNLTAAKASSRSLVNAGLAISLAVLLGRASGFVRELLVARNFGVSHEADIAVLLLTLPDLLVTTLAGGAFGAALIPEFRRLAVCAPYAESALYRQVLLLTGAAFTVATVAMSAGSRYFVAVLAPGFHSTAADVATAFIPVAIWAVPFTAMTMVTTSYLQSNDRFGFAASGTLLGNLLLVSALIGWPGSLHALSVAIVGVGLSRWCSQLLAIRLYGLRRRVHQTAGGLITSGLIRRYLEAMGASSLIFFAPLMTRALASMSGEGSVALLNYATKLVELPLGAFVGVIGIVFFPRLSDLFVRNGSAAATDGAKHGLSAAIALSVPTALALLVFGTPIAAAIFGRGAMNDTEVDSVGALTAVSALSIPSIGMAAVLQGLLNAKGDTSAPLIVSAITLPIYLLAGLLALRIGGLLGLASASVALQWMVLAGFEIQLRSRHRVALLDWSYAKSVINAVIAGVIAFVPLAALGLTRDGLFGMFICAAAGTVLSLTVMMLFDPFRQALKFARG